MRFMHFLNGTDYYNNSISETQYQKSIDERKIKLHSWRRRKLWVFGSQWCWQNHYHLYFDRESYGFPGSCAWLVFATNNTMHSEMQVLNSCQHSL